MEIITQSAPETEKLGEKIAGDLIKGDGSCLASSPKKTRQARTPFWGSPDASHPSQTNLKKIEEKQGAVVLALYGELGSGKTTFVKGLAKGLGLPRRILSPTFIVVREYPLAHKNFRRFYHIDLYRMETQADLAGLGISDIFQNPGAIVAVEWAERLGGLLPEARLDIRFSQIDESRRKITIKE